MSDNKIIKLINVKELEIRKLQYEVELRCKSHGRKLKMNMIT